MAWVRCPRILRAVAMAGLLCVGAVAADWLPVTDAERRLGAPRVEKDAAAEVLFWDVHVVQAQHILFPLTTLEHYIRIKVFTQRGCETQGTVSLPESAAGTVSGRTIKRDGRILELSKDAVSVRDAVVVPGAGRRMVVFVLPAVEPGDIVEYRWSESRFSFSRTPWSETGYSFLPHVRLDFQRDIPVQQVRYFIRATVPDEIRYEPPVLSTAVFQAKLPPLVKAKGGFYTTSMDNVPSYVEEPTMPPEAQAKPWMLLHYIEAKKTPEEYWRDKGREIFGYVKRVVVVDGQVRRAEAEAAAGAKDPEDTLARLARYCRAKIKDEADDDAIGPHRTRARQNSSPAEILKRGLGTPSNVNVLFAGMAQAAGFETRVAMVADRGDIPFSPALVDVDLLPREAIAVKLGEQWRFYDVGARGLPPGMLPWQEEGVPALVSDPKQAVFAKTQLSGPEKSVTSRNGTFELKEDGTLEGEVRLAYTGHSAAERRTALKTESPAQREEGLRDSVRKQFEGAEVSSVKVDNIEDAEQPLTCSYRVKVPAYAQTTGKRISLQLGYFERDQPARFPAAGRRYPVVFDYAWTEEDQITVKVPAGYDLENSEAPSPLNLGEAGEYEVTAGAGAGRLVYHRRLVFGRGGRLVFPVASYLPLKQVFDAIHERDQRTLTLRQSASPAAHSVNPPSTVSAWPVM